MDDVKTYFASKIDIPVQKLYYGIMNDKLVDYVLQQKSLRINNEDIKRQLLTVGWGEKEIDSALNLHLAKEKGNKKLQISLLVVGLLIFLGLVFNLISTHPYNSFKIDPSIKIKNDALLVEIETQEIVLHDILHSTLENGKIPISKGVAVIFRMADLLHLQNELMEISDKINDLQHSELLKHNQANIDKMVLEMKNTQEIVSKDLSDKTHDGTLDPAWFTTP